MKVRITKVFQGVDLAISAKSSADYFCIVTIGLSEDGKIFVLDVLREKGMSFYNQVSAIIKKAAEFHPLRIGVESNSYQAAMVGELERLTVLPVVPIITVRDKMLRFQARSALVETHRVYVSHGMHDFVSELVSLSPDGSSEHDDQADSLDFALTVAEEPQSNAVQNDYFIPEFNNV